MGSGQSSVQEADFGELLFERGNDSLSVEVHTAEHEGDTVTVFTYTSDKEHRPVTINTLQSYKVLRHPNILKLVTCTEPTSTSYVITEPATPLCVCLDYINGWEVMVGLSKILEALHFLHTKAGFSHNNVSMESIFVTPDGRWTLGRLDCARKLSSNSTAHITSVTPLCDSDIFTEKAAQVAPVAHCRDIHGFGRVCEALIDKLEDFDQEVLGDFTELIDLMLSEDNSEVPTAEDILSQPLFQNQLVLTLKFIEDISLKTAGERKHFFSALMDYLYSLPEVVVAKQLVRPLLRRFVVEDPVACTLVLPFLLRPKTDDDSDGLLSPSTYEKYLVPVLYKLFTVREFNIRMLLLRHFHCYCHLFDDMQAEKFVMPLILQGLHDSNDTMVSQSLVALANLVTVLGGHVVIGTEREDLFKDTQTSYIPTPSTAEQHQPPRRSKDLEAKVEVAEPPVMSPRRQRPNHPPRKPRERKDSNKPLKLGVRKKSVDTSPQSSVSGTEATDLGHLPGSPVVENDGTATPVGSERTASTADSDVHADSDQEASDWEDVNSPRLVPSSPSKQPLSPKPSASVDLSGRKKERSGPSKLSAVKSAKPPKINDDFSELDIKSSISKSSAPKIIDFFADMMPPLEGSSQSSASKAADGKQAFTGTAKNLAYAMNDVDEAKGGWACEEDGWDW